MKCANPWWLEGSGNRAFFIACNKCLYCRIQRRKLWTIRMLHERESWQDACFTTLTYNQENLPPRGLKKKDLQNFFKRLRKLVTPLRYFACGEYGEQTNRPHYHAIIFGLSKALACTIIPMAWGYGSTENGHAEEDSIRYVAGYIDKKWMAGDQRSTEYMGKPPPFQVQSQGIGKEYWLQHYHEFLDDGFKFRGKPQAIPRYYVELLKTHDPVAHAYFLEQNEEKQRVRESDEVLELLPETGGIPIIELTKDQRDEIRAHRKLAGINMQAHLKAKASIYALKANEKGKN